MLQVHVIANCLERRGSRKTAGPEMELSGFPCVFQSEAEQQVRTAGLEETLNVYRNYHPDHSCHRPARRLQRHRRRSVLRHGILRWRRLGPRGGYLADPVVAWKALI